MLHQYHHLSPFHPRLSHQRGLKYEKMEKDNYVQICNFALVPIVYSMFDSLSKSMWGEQPPRIFLNSLSYLCMCVIVIRLLATLTTIHTWNLAHILPLTLSKNLFFFDQITVTAASLKKLPCHLDFTHLLVLLDTSDTELKAVWKIGIMCVTWWRHTNLTGKEIVFKK